MNNISERVIEKNIEKISKTLNGIFDNIEIVSDHLKLLWVQFGENGRKPNSDDIKGILSTIDEVLTNADSYMVGAGVVFAPDILEDQEKYIEWRRYNERGEIESLRLNFSENSESYYDYTNRPWFGCPRDKGVAYIEGPYIDLFGQNSYILTCVLPLVIDNKFIGITGADIILSELEEALTESLLNLPVGSAIVTSEGRVVVSTSPEISSGEIAFSKLKRIDYECYELDLNQKLSDVWWLLLLSNS